MAVRTPTRADNFLEGGCDGRGGKDEELRVVAVEAMPVEEDGGNPEGANASFPGDDEIGS